MERELIEQFLNKSVIFQYDDCGKITLRRGTIVKVTDSAMVINFNSEDQLYSLDTIKHVRKADTNGY